VQTDIGTSIERDRLLGRLNLPQREDAPSIRHKRRRIVRPLTDNAPSKAIAKELPRACKIANAQPDMIETERAGVDFVCHVSDHLEIAYLVLVPRDSTAGTS
jgi:hypothetical protein